MFVGKLSAENFTCWYRQMCKLGYTVNIVLFFVPVLPFFILSYLAVLLVIGHYTTLRSYARNRCLVSDLQIGV